METESKSKISGWKIAFIFLTVIILSAVAYYSVMTILSPRKKLAEMKSEYSSRKTESTNGSDKFKTDAEYISLLKKKAFLQSRVTMAETDSIYLTLNFSDSTANVELSGVVVHAAKMSDFEISSILNNDNDIVMLSKLSKPFNIAGSISTIKKEPVMIKMAPKDTTEYKPDIMPDTTKVEPVNYILQMSDGTRIYVYQKETEIKSDRMSYLKFDMKDRLQNTWEAIKSVAKMKVPEYHPYIKLRLPRKDAKVIYRAIPRKGQVGIYL
jgi:hypothetical protein